MATIFAAQVNLKRKHFVPDDSRSRSSKRCTAIFEQQLATAQAAGSRQQGSTERVAQPGGPAQRAKQQKVAAASTALDTRKKQAKADASWRPAVQVPSWLRHCPSQEQMEAFCRGLLL